MTPPLKVLRQKEMGDLGVEMTEIVETEERVAEMKDTGENNKNENTGRAGGGGGGNQYGPQGGGSGRKRQRY